MIISVIKNVATIKGIDGQTFKVDLNNKIVRVPVRDGTGDSMMSVFDFGTLLLENKIAPYTTADEATSAKYLIQRKWLESSEKHRCLQILGKFLESKRQERRDDAVIKLVELYGIERGKKLSNAVRARQFWFPAFYMREESVAAIVNFLLNSAVGAASACSWTPSSKNQALKVMSMYSNSKAAVKFRTLINGLEIADNRIKPVFDIARYLETTN